MEVEGLNMVFYLEKNANVARALVNMSGRFMMGSGHKIHINCSESPPPTRKINPAQVISFF